MEHISSEMCFFFEWDKLLERLDILERRWVNQGDLCEVKDLVSEWE
jgi:hypothetical protein